MRCRFKFFLDEWALQIRSIEIKRDGKLEKMYFVVPDWCGRHWRTTPVREMRYGKICTVGSVLCLYFVFGTVCSSVSIARFGRGILNCFSCHVDRKTFFFFNFVPIATANAFFHSFFMGLNGVGLLVVELCVIFYTLITQQAAYF